MLKSKNLFIWWLQNSIFTCDSIFCSRLASWVFLGFVFYGDSWWLPACTLLHAWLGQKWRISTLFNWKVTIQINSLFSHWVGHDWSYSCGIGDLLTILSSLSFNFLFDSSAYARCLMQRVLLIVTGASLTSIETSVTVVCHVGCRFHYIILFVIGHIMVAAWPHMVICVRSKRWMTTTVLVL